MNSSKKMSKYLLWFANEHIYFRIPEIKTIAASQKIKIKWMEPLTNEPFLIIGLENDVFAKDLTSKSMLVKYCIKLLNTGHSMIDLHQNIKKFNLAEISPLVEVGKTYKMNVESFNKKLKLSEKLEKIDSFQYLDCKGKVDLNMPETTFHLLEYYGLPSNNADSHVLQRVFFGVYLCKGGRMLMDVYTLKERSFISNTSMDPQLAFIMANMAAIKSGDIVIDPFVGSGSILVSAAQRGAYVWGWDIDYVTLHGLSKPTRVGQKQRQSGENVLRNLKQYGLENRYLDIAIMDNTNLMWRNVPIIDAIITDPPYGVRESMTKIKSEELNGEIHPFHIPTKASCNSADTFNYLLTFAAKTLKIGGKLIYWLPIIRENYSEDNIPTHPCLQIFSNSEQALTSFSSRRLITMFKTREPMEEDFASTHLVCDATEFRKRFCNSPKKLSKKEKILIKSSFDTDKRGQAFKTRLIT